jgi:hypothetical protein
MDGAPVGDIPTLVALAEAPLWGDAKFFGRWLIAAAEAQQALEAALAADPGLQQRFVCDPEIYLGIDAMLYIHYLVGSYCSFVIDINGPDADGFFLLAEMGFFAHSGTRYQMTIPESITPKDAAVAIERLMSTEDENGVRRHEDIIKCMPKCEAEQWQRRLDSLSDRTRLTDRRLLLGLEPDDPTSGFIWTIVPNFFRE